MNSFPKAAARAALSAGRYPIDRKWHLINAANEIVGRLATRVTDLLTAKHKLGTRREGDHGDYVVIYNARKLVFTGDKLEQKLYRKHSGYPGGLKEVKAEDLMVRKDRPEHVIIHAVSGMIPKNKLRKFRLGRLRVYADDDVAESDLVNCNSPSALKQKDFPVKVPLEPILPVGALKLQKEASAPK